VSLCVLLGHVVLCKPCHTLGTCTLYLRSGEYQNVWVFWQLFGISAYPTTGKDSNDTPAGDSRSWLPGKRTTMSTVLSKDHSEVKDRQIYNRLLWIYRDFKITTLVTCYNYLANFTRTVATFYRWGGRIYNLWCDVSSGFWLPKLLKFVHFLLSYKKHKKVTL